VVVVADYDCDGATAWPRDGPGPSDDDGAVVDFGRPLRSTADGRTPPIVDLVRMHPGWHRPGC
jgi:hypothetical protein